jgi:hypothetical protein
VLTFSKLICAQIDYLKKVTALLDMFDILYQTQGDFLTFPTHTDHGNLCVHAIDRSCVCIRMYNQTLAIHLLVLCLHMIADVAEGGYPGESDKSAKNRMNSGKGVGHTIILKCGVGKCVPLCIVVAEGDSSRVCPECISCCVGYFDDVVFSHAGRSGMHVCGAWHKNGSMVYGNFAGTYASFPADLRHRSLPLGHQAGILKIAFFFRVLGNNP